MNLTDLFRKGKKAYKSYKAGEPERLNRKIAIAKKRAELGRINAQRDAMKKKRMDILIGSSDRNLEGSLLGENNRKKGGFERFL